MPEKDKTYFDIRWKSQIKKGLLEYITLLLLKQRSYYGYELIEKMKRMIAFDIAEGTLYPLLNRLKKEDLVTSQWTEMETGIPRKYYKITDEGLQQLIMMRNYFEELVIAIRSIEHQ